MNVSNKNNATTAEKRECRCMFCGEILILASEEEAVAHMGVCPAMQEQLNGFGAFTIPKEINERMKTSQEDQKKEN